MLRVKDMYINTNDILSLEYHFEDRWQRHYMAIRYKYSNEVLNIEVENFDEYESLADMITTVVNNKQNNTNTE